jgi:hypothetical protein
MVGRSEGFEDLFRMPTDTEQGLDAHGSGVFFIHKCQVYLDFLCFRMPPV